MLRKEAVSPKLLKVLNELMEMRSLSNHRLVGGTALALQIGHRISLVIDLFSGKKNNYSDILSELKQHFGEQVLQNRSIDGPMGKGMGFIIHEIKTNIIDWNTKFIRPALIMEQVRLADKEDIIPMKFNTFLCAPEFARYEKKDYADIAALMNEFSLDKMIELYKIKYPEYRLTDRLIIEGLQLNEMADKKAMPKMLNGITWKDVKRKIEASISFFIESSIKKNKQ